MEIMDILMPVPTWMMLIMAISGLAYYYYQAVYGVFKRIGVYNPFPLPIVGNAMFLIKNGFFQSVRHGYDTFKSKRMYGIFEGTHAILTVIDLDMLREIMVKQFNNFMNRHQYAALNQKGVSSIMFNTVGSDWKEYRTLLKPSLAPSRLRAAAPQIEKIAKRMCDVIEEQAAKDNEIDVSGILGSFCMDAVTEIGFDLQYDTLRNPDNDFASTLRKFLNELGTRMFVFEIFAPPLLKEVLDYLGVLILPHKEVTFLRDFTKNIMSKRRAKPSEQNPQDFIQYVLDHSEDGVSSNTNIQNRRTFSDEKIYGSAVTFLLAGYDTTSKGLFYCAFCLAMHPECFKQAQQEVDEKLKGEFPCLDNVDRLTYLEKCISESNRLYPLGFITERTCLRDTIVGGQFIPAGVTIRVPIGGIHYDPDLWPNPTVYDPERFTPEMIEKRHPMAFLPFGAGPRACFGQPMALMLLRIAMASMLQRFTIEPCAKSIYPVRIIPLSDLVNDHPLYVKVTPRNK